MINIGQVLADGPRARQRPRASVNKATTNAQVQATGLETAAR
jgi:hypothetical protein